MTKDELLKIKLLMNYEICNLYVNSGASTRIISDETGVPLATIKRALKSLDEKRKDYLRLFPELMTNEKLEKLSQEVLEVTSYNVKNTKWSDKEISFTTYGDTIERIKTYKEQIDTMSKHVTEGDIAKIQNLRIMGKSIREIGAATGFALSTIHKVLEGTSRAK